MAPITGEVIYLYAFDIAYELDREPLERLLGQPVEQFVIEPQKRLPRQLFFHRPQVVRLPAVEYQGPRGPVRVSTSVKLLPVGAITITMRVPVEVERLADLIPHHDPSYGGQSLHDRALQLAEEIRRELRPRLVRPIQRIEDEEAYTVFCLDARLLGTASAEQWFAGQRREIAALLTQESEAASLADEEVAESTARALSYYRHDLAVLDWDAALILDRQPIADELLYIIELANLQLTELEAYDRILDETIERAYRDLSGRRPERRVLRQVGEMRIDLARLSDELSNTTKFFGDWHLARVHAALAGRFHLADWHRSIDDKLKTLDGLYQVLMHARNNRLMLILESTVVVLFLIDLAVLVAEWLGRAPPA
jgi:hypothetical protein